MNKLTTERLEQYAHDKHMCNINDEIREMARQLLAYEQAAKNPIGSFHISGGQVEATTDYCRDGEWPVQDGEVLVYAVPVLPKQPESRNEIMAKGVESFAKDWKGSARYSRISEMACNFAAKIRNGDADEC
ncbi:hypothetical protein [Hafnia paralvei]|uniref:hypothetical protein n=1 Tax=Hafnia paralvei TaxID=546367 RepID=UPI00241F4466|nr:hypothetical protein [Hafnia paralvei]